ncbi:ABC transporter substrate-binding protein [Aliidongia dinghuensis]|uniref:ABC transporter substrate-binding protein n=1 Tax=Aliidongia dinghuensis TaxID=1867774 RepID=A0A8J3E571_9PROT|nr:ABC transporter substrate-binding protein [Aliidongia dinghuensis]GGF33386.1 ABC transporter substrate-binding protein [Aliidongia dinghuensis]
MRLALTAVLIAAAVGIAGHAQAQDKVRIATEGAYAPFNYKAPDGTLEGFDVDIAKALCDHAHLECLIVAQDWDGIIPGLLAKKYDAIVASMSITDERKKKVDFTDKYYQTPARFVEKKGADFTISKEGLKGKTIGAQRSTIHAQYLQENYADVADIKLYDSQENADLDLTAGRLDLVLADSIVLLEGFLNKPEGQDFEFVGPELKDPKWFGEGAGIAVRPGDTKLKDAFDKALAEIRKDGTYDKIDAKYFPFSIY